MINVKNLRRWIAALRSRKYKQQTGSLYGPGNLSCALGVAGREFFNASKDNYVYIDDISEKLGMSYSFYNKIVSLNDDRGLKFYQIARYLERKFKKELNNG